jgi:hypothetical protein
LTVAMTTMDMGDAHPAVENRGGAESMRPRWRSPWRDLGGSRCRSKSEIGLSQRTLTLKLAAMAGSCLCPP